MNTIEVGGVTPVCRYTLSFSAFRLQPMTEVVLLATGLTVVGTSTGRVAVVVCDTR